jgi:hypothetical protein
VSNVGSGPDAPRKNEKGVLQAPLARGLICRRKKEKGEHLEAKKQIPKRYAAKAI